MVRQIGWITSVIVAGLLAGCDNGASTPPKHAATTQPTTAPTTQASAISPTTQPATQPAFSQLMIDGRPYSFPDARLRVDQSNDRVVARLYSDDPKAALDDGYKGNNYDLLLKLDDIHDPRQIYMATWQYRAASWDYVNTPYGIFLDGMRYQLQPLDASARFLGTMMTVQISLEGRFLMFDDDDKSAAPKVVYVKGSLLAPVEYKD